MNELQLYLKSRLHKSKKKKRIHNSQDQSFIVTLGILSFCCLNSSAEALGTFLSCAEAVSRPAVCPWELLWERPQHAPALLGRDPPNPRGPRSAHFALPPLLSDTGRAEIVLTGTLFPQQGPLSLSLASLMWVTVNCKLP